MCVEGTEFRFEGVCQSSQSDRKRLGRGCYLGKKGEAGATVPSSSSTTPNTPLPSKHTLGHLNLWAHISAPAACSPWLPAPPRCRATHAAHPGHTQALDSPAVDLGRRWGNPSHFLLTSQPLGGLTTGTDPCLGPSRSLQTAPSGGRGLGKARAAGPLAPPKCGRSQGQRVFQNKAGAGEPRLRLE